MKNRTSSFLILVLIAVSLLGGGCSSSKDTTYSAYPFPIFVPGGGGGAEAGFRLSQDYMSISLGETGRIGVTLNGVDVSGTATYTVADPGVARVDGGEITPVGPGTTTVTVHIDGFPDQIFTITVTDPALPSLTLSRDSFIMYVDDTDRVTVMLGDSDVTETAAYAPLDSKIASVDKGVIRAGYSEGETRVVVSLEGANDATFTVKVIDDSTPVTLDDGVLSRLYSIGLMDVEPSQKMNGYTEVDIPAIFRYNNAKYKIVGVGDGVFRECYSMTSLTLPATVTSIGDSSFQDCHRLADFEIPEGVTSIGRSAFCKCHDLREVVIPYGVERIEDETFYDCPQLESVTIPDSVVYIGANAFHNCDKLDLTVPDSVLTIGDNAFGALRHVHYGGSATGSPWGAHSVN